MKTQHKKLAFKTKAIVELQNDDLHSINGGTATTVIVGPTSLFTRLITK
ncbi:hypothetical protein N7U66_12650 [Lacinutrix neustonica]|uniref:Uncharacterized protein n=1 Tax=Lacinutrix neustonica TaxID=2980107 RepID=A0A9E8SFS0_9FLAO|nr:hypothetical protein [Lacinutrix neustonica]WAC01025.1 hypothetical protein N7U66_12650 [Lacinutrix neustonica]